MTRTMDELTAKDIAVGQEWMRVAVEPRRQKRFTVRSIERDNIRLVANDGESRFVKAGQLLAYWLLTEEA